MKSQDTGAALDVLAPLAGPETGLVSLQNGMNPPRIAARLGAARTMGAFVNFGAAWQGRGISSTAARAPSTWASSTGG